MSPVQLSAFQAASGAKAEAASLLLLGLYARDAAFYWLQLDTGDFSPIVTPQKRAHFQRQLRAHLDGLRAAGDEGWEAAYKNYQRWKTESEAFVCCVLAVGCWHWMLTTRHTFKRSGS